MQVCITVLDTIQTLVCGEGVSNLQGAVLELFIVSMDEKRFRTAFSVLFVP